jgi:hypothetical protein
MKGDFSRLRFSPNKNYTSVLQQQGRVALDADANEQCAINEYLRTTETVDVVGRVGGPLGDDGFHISVQNGAIEIGKGRYYVDGLLCENEQAGLLYSSQPFLINPGSAHTDTTLISNLTLGSVIQVYLQVWQRLVTALDDPCLREPALGQADTTARLQTVWRVIAKAVPGPQPRQLAGSVTLATGSQTVTGTGTTFTSALEVGQQLVFASDKTQTMYKIGAIASNTSLTLASPYAGPQASTTVSVVVPEDCCTAMDRVDVVKTRGKLSVPPIDVSEDCSCQPTPSAGYRGLENQLYRVEIHQHGDETKATFKWSRDNGSVVAAITNVSGNQVYVDSLGPDANLGFSPGQWVEITDDRNEFGEFGADPNQPGDLYQIYSITPETLCVTMVPQPVVASVNLTMNPRMRRWDQFGSSAGSSGVSLSESPLDLENGIQVQFKPGQYVSGDHWLIPARTSTGQVEWPPCDSDQCAFQPPYFAQIYQAPLACITLRDNKPWARDCRTKFPPLTDITASYVYYDPRKCSQLASAKTVQQALDILCGDLQGPCTIVPKPGPGWETPLMALKPGQDADICFPIGNFPLTKQPLLLKGLGNIRMSGGGPGTTIVATGAPAALIFSQCKSVQISDLYASADTVQIRRNRTSGTPALGGTLSFADCGDVTVENVSLKCGYAEVRAAACIDVQNSYVTQSPTQIKLGTQATGTGEVRIRHCNLSVGRNQDGILLVRAQRVQVEDNILAAYTPKTYTFAQRIQSRLFRSNVLRELVSQATYVKAVTAAPAAPAAPAPAAPSVSKPATAAAQEKAAPAKPAVAEAAPAEATPAKPATETAAPAEATAEKAAAATPTSATLSAPSGKVEMTAPASTTAAKTSTAAEAATTIAAPVGIQLPVKKLQFTTVNIGKQVVSFQTSPLLKDFWQTYLSAKAPAQFATNRDLLLYVKKTATDFLLQSKLRAGNSALATVIASVEKTDQIAMARGIAVGGEGIQECRILNNSIQDAVQGITVGTSNHKKSPKVRESATAVTIAGNQIYVGLPLGAQFHARHAIFVGNVNSLLIENNCAEVLANPNNVTVWGIWLYGVFGRRLIVSHCHLAGFNVGILIEPLSTPNRDNPPLWFAGENMAENAKPVVAGDLQFVRQSNNLP